MVEQLNLSESEWRKRLRPEQYHVLREAGTEAPFSGFLTDNTANGVYRCAGCQLELFDSADKYDSGAGWPSFTQPIADDHVVEHADARHEISRVELRCARCDGHLGHIVPDGPPPAGLRYCVNSAGLDFRSRGGNANGASGEPSGA